MIPNRVHFIFGLESDFGGRPFSYLHYLAVASVYAVQSPKEIIFHYAHEPEGKWWERAKTMVKLNKVQPPEEIFGNKLTHYAHKADVLRLEFLRDYGGMYLDMDVITLNPYDPLLEHRFVMGIQAQRGFCNAVMLAEPNTPFINTWYREYRSFDHTQWDYHSVFLPYKLFSERELPITVLKQQAFFYPNWNDPSLILWEDECGYGPFMKALVKKKLFMLKQMVRLKKTLFYYPWLRNFLPSREYHYNILSKAFCIHLWEKLWWDDYLKHLSPRSILTGENNFSILMRKKLGKEIINGSVSVSAIQM